MHGSDVTGFCKDDDASCENVCLGEKKISREAIRRELRKQNHKSRDRVG